jgi:hypothetical protein
MKIAFLHTAQVHVDTFETLLKTVSPSASATHHVAPDLLTRAQSAGLASVEHETSKLLIELSRADAVLCTCSTLGPITDLIATTHPNVTRVDRPLMEAACEFGSNPMIAICLESTREATLALLQDCAEQTSATVTPHLVLCDTAWPFFEKGDTAAFAQQISNSIRHAIAQSGHPDCIVLGQASMRVAAAELADLGVPVLSSPQLAIERVMDIAASASKASNI